MSDQFEDRVKRFNELEIPPTQRFTTGPEESVEIGKLRDEYFERVTASLALSKRALEAFFRVEYRVLGIEQADGLHISDDFDASLWLVDVQPLASVRNVRDTANFQVILFAKYDIDPASMRHLQPILSLSDLSSG